MAASPGDLTFDPNDNTRRQDEWARRLEATVNVQDTRAAPFHNRTVNTDYRGIKPRFRFGSVWQKNAVSVPVSITVTTLTINITIRPVDLEVEFHVVDFSHINL